MKFLCGQRCVCFSRGIFMDYLNLKIGSYSPFTTSNSNYSCLPNLITIKPKLHFNQTYIDVYLSFIDFTTRQLCLFRLTLSFLLLWIFSPYSCGLTDSTLPSKNPGTHSTAVCYFLITILCQIIFINNIIHKTKQNIWSITFVVAWNCAFCSMVHNSLRNILYFFRRWDFNLEDGTDKLSRNVDKELLLHLA